MVTYKRNAFNWIARDNGDGSESTFPEADDNRAWREIADDVASGAIVIAPADPPPEPEPSDAAMIGEMIGSIEFSGDEASEELAAVMMALTGVLQARGF